MKKTDEELLRRARELFPEAFRDHPEPDEDLLRRAREVFPEAFREKIQINLSGMLGTVDIDEWAAVKLCNELLSKISESDIVDELKAYPHAAGGNERDLLRKLIIGTLVKKFGLKISCGNCKFLHRSPGDPKNARGCTKNPDYPELDDLTVDEYWVRREENLGDFCPYWQPKEVSKKSK